MHCFHMWFCVTLLDWWIITITALPHGVPSIISSQDYWALEKMPLIVYIYLLWYLATWDLRAFRVGQNFGHIWQYNPVVDTCLASIWLFKVVLYFVVYPQSTQTYKPSSERVVFSLMISFRAKIISNHNLLSLCFRPTCVVRACLVGQTVGQ